jgi:hypothetical protein
MLPDDEAPELTLPVGSNNTRPCVARRQSRSALCVSRRRHASVAGSKQCGECGPASSANLLVDPRVTGSELSLATMVIATDSRFVARRRPSGRFFRTA